MIALLFYGGIFMEISTLSEYGIAAIFIYSTWRLYTDMRTDSSKREDKLMDHMKEQMELQDKKDDKQMEINTKTIEALESITVEVRNVSNRLCCVELMVQKEGVKND